MKGLSLLTEQDRLFKLQAYSDEMMEKRLNGSIITCCRSEK